MIQTRWLVIDGITGDVRLNKEHTTLSENEVAYRLEFDLPKHPRVTKLINDLEPHFTGDTRSGHWVKRQTARMARALEKAFS